MQFDLNQLLYIGVVLVALGFVYLMLRKEMLPPRFFIGGGVYTLILYLLWRNRAATIVNGAALAIIFAILIAIPLLRNRIFPEQKNKSRSE